AISSPIVLTVATRSAAFLGSSTSPMSLTKASLRVLPSLTIDLISSRYFCCSSVSFIGVRSAADRGVEDLIEGGLVIGGRWVGRLAPAPDAVAHVVKTHRGQRLQHGVICCFRREARQVNKVFFDLLQLREDLREQRVVAGIAL